MGIAIDASSLLSMRLMSEEPAIESCFGGGDEAKEIQLTNRLRL